MSRHAERLRIDGRVQGVGYRWWAVDRAAALGLQGWVRNRRDGSVELLAIGEQAAVAALAELCGDGPSGAVVRSVTSEPAADDGSRGFTQRATE